MDIIIMLIVILGFIILVSTYIFGYYAGKDRANSKFIEEYLKELKEKYTNGDN